MKRCKYVCYSIRNKEACFPKVQNSNNLAPAIVRRQSSVLHNNCALMKARDTSWKSSHSQRNNNKKIPPFQIHFKHAKQQYVSAKSHFC